MVEGRCRFQIERGKHLHSLGLGYEEVVFADAAFTLLLRACKENGDRVEVGASQPANPVIGVVGASVAQNTGSSNHALAEFLGKACKRSLVHP